MFRSTISGLLFAGLALGLNSCKDEDPIVIIVPPKEIPHEKVDQFYYVQFQWGKPKEKDTITFEVPDDTLTLTEKNTWDTLKDYYNIPYELKNEPVLDSTNALEKVELDETILRTGWHYAPASVFYNRRYNMYYRGKYDSKVTEEMVNRNIFEISFPWKRLGTGNDTLPFWDIQDYLANPSIHVGSVPWGRVGVEKLNDSVYTFNNDAYTGVSLTYTDKNGIVWSTGNLPGFQTGEPTSYFIVKELYRNQRDEDSYYIMEAEFSGKFYSEEGGMTIARGGKVRFKILTDIELGPKPE